MTFGEKLLKLRKEGGLSQEGLAEKLSVSRQAVSRWENEGILPDCVNLLEISRLFGVSTDYLLHDDYQSDGDLPAVRTARDQLAGEKERQGVLLLLAGLHAVFLLLAVGESFHRGPLRRRQPGGYHLCGSLAPQRPGPGGGGPQPAPPLLPAGGLVFQLVPGTMALRGGVRLLAPARQRDQHQRCYSYHLVGGLRGSLVDDRGEEIGFDIKMYCYP